MATYRGHVSKKLSGLLVSGDLVPSRGDPVMKDDREIGIVTSALRSPSLGATVALAYLKHGFSEPNSAVQLHINDKIVPAVIAKLPFYPKAY
jgi:aminomethyltransferase